MMLSESFFAKRFRSQSGIALVLVLSLVVLLTAVVLLFLSRAMAGRQLSSGSLQQSNADQLALSALDIITGSLKQEIVDPANSISTTYGSGTTQTTVYSPKVVANVLPTRYTGPSSTPPPNLVRISSSSDTTLQYPSRASAGLNSTSNPSLNQRAVSLARWNSHYLLPAKDPTKANTDSTPDSTFTAPDWVLVTDSGGPTVLTTPNASVIGRYAYAIYDEGGLLDVNVAGFPSNATASQYGEKPALAYADLTQLALPSTPSVSLLTAADIDNLVGWRNYASVQPSGSFGSFKITTATQLLSFFNLITTNSSGFRSISTTVSPDHLTDQAFLSRQQLLQFRVSTGFDANALQYLGTFSRDLNAPTWKPVNPPAQSTAVLPTMTPAIPVFDYVTPMDSSTAVNRDVVKLRVTTSFTRADGTTAQKDEALLKARFPLSRLAGLTYQGIDTTNNTTLINGVVAPATAASVQRDFGLVWVAGNGSGDPTDIASAPHWNYCGPTGSTIQSSIALIGSIGNREPNFFELLKAAILTKSLGRDAGKKGAFRITREEGPASDTPYADANVDFQVIQIGANMMNQAATDGYPREIHFLGQNTTGGATNQETAIFGIANLPYLQRVFTRNVYTGQKLEAWYMAEVWNPHQSLATNNVTASPTQFRFAGIGLTQMFYNPKYGIALTVDTNPAHIVTLTTPAQWDLSKSGYLQFTVPWNDPTICREPTYLVKDGTFNDGTTTYTPTAAPTILIPTTVQPGTNGRNDAKSDGRIVGLYAGAMTTPSKTADTSTTIPAGTITGGSMPQNCSLVLEYLAPDGTWRIYNEMRYLWGFKDQATGGSFYFQHSDPRTDRFGTSLGNWTIFTTDSTKNNQPGHSIRMDSTTASPTAYIGTSYFPRPNQSADVTTPYTPAPFPSSGFIYQLAIPGGSFSMGTLSDNVASSSNPYYVDPDGVLRSGEGYWNVTTGSGSGTDGRPLATGNTNSRPILLNRPFRNVGELGYAFRDLPWRNVDFFTPYTADHGLLDFFCARESSTPVVAGTVNLNTRQAPVLQAILAGAAKNQAAPSSTATVPGLPTASSDAATLATSLVSLTGGKSSGKGPFLNRSELATRLVAGVPFPLVVATASTGDKYIKTRREAALRALSEVSSTRVWNLMIDVVAQAGHYPSTSTTLGQFVVDGEKRYWLHIAVDRLTGQVLDRSLEPVYE